MMGCTRLVSAEKHDLGLSKAVSGQLLLSCAELDGFLGLVDAVGLGMEGFRLAKVVEPSEGSEPVGPVKTGSVEMEVAGQW